MKEKTHHTLLVDNSNTRTKFSLMDDRGEECGFATLPTSTLSVASVRALLADRGWTCKLALICSVVPRTAAMIAEAVDAKVHQLGPDSPMPLTLDYPEPATLGADRIANVIAAAAFAPLPCVVLDFGTAVTFDVLEAGEEHPRFAGGVIAPGLGAMAEYLGRNTALLPALEPRKAAHAIGRSTQEALHAGSYYGYCGLVRGILQALSEELGEKPYVIATGGDAEMLASWLPEINCVRPRLTFEGLSRVAKSLC